MTGNKVTIRGVDRIRTHGLLKIGLADVGFVNHHDGTFLNVRGELDVQSDFSIGRGCRFDIGSNAIVRLGGGYVAAQSTFIIMHGLTIGNGCAISWGCQFLDEDFHELQYEGKKTRPNEIIIEDHVWIGSNVSVLKGSYIPEGCVVASGAVVSSRFDKKFALIAGNPARIIRENVKWS